MARVIKRVWWGRGPTGHRTKRVAFGYTCQVDGKQVRKFDAAWDKDGARDALATRVLERDVPPPPPAPKTLAQLAGEYLEFKRGKGKRSIRRDEQVIATLKARLGSETPLPEITAQRIASYDRDRVGEISARLKRPVTPSTVNRELAILRHMLRLAEEWGYLEKVPRIRLAREPEGRLRFLSEEEIRRLLDACQESKSTALPAVVTLALHTGMRKGEILGLQWEQVDFARGVLTLERTKSGRRREVPMNRPVYDALSALPAHKDEGLVFRKASGTAAWGNIRTAFERACRVAKVADFRFHDLRHTCASWLVMRGRSLKEVQEILGHREFSMTLRYAHLSPDRLRDAVASLEDFSTKSAHSAKIGPSRFVSPLAPVAQVDRAAVS